MESTFDTFITNNPAEKAKFDKAYNDFLLSEFILEKMEAEQISVRSLAKKADVSPTAVQKLRNGKTAQNIRWCTLVSVLRSLGYTVSFTKI